MIGIDTSVLVRLLTNDEPIQNARAKDFFADRNARDPAYVSAIVLAETLWVLRRRLGYPREAVMAALRELLASDDFRFQHADRLTGVLDGPNPPPAGIADYLIAWSADAEGCTHTVTFDRRAAKAVPGMELLA
jgi:predicted nucleic-acid-binding protein